MLACEQSPAGSRDACGGVVEDGGLACGCNSEFLRYQIRLSKEIPPHMKMKSWLLDTERAECRRAPPEPQSSNGNSKGAPSSGLAQAGDASTASSSTTSSTPPSSPLFKLPSTLTAEESDPMLFAIDEKHQPLCPTSTTSLLPFAHHGRNTTLPGHLLPLVPLVIDVGAHDGSDALRFAHEGFTVLSFEPSPMKGETIETNIADAQEEVRNRITLMRAAVSHRVGNATFWVAKYGAGGSEQDMLGQPPWATTTQSACPVDVPVTTLDSIVGERQVLFAKIDAQGHDAEVIAGSQKLIRKGLLKLLQFEVSPGLSVGGPAPYMEALSFLAHLGFSCYICGEKAEKQTASSWLAGLSRIKLMVHDGNQGGYGNVVCDRHGTSTSRRGG